MTGIAQLSLVEAATAVETRQLSSRDLVEACLSRIETLQPVLNCFIRVDGEAALEAADRADRMVRDGARLGPLHGVPLAHKDIFYRAGQVTSCGSKIRRDFVPTNTATVIERLNEAGAITLGTLNMSEFALGPTGHNSHWGDCHNAWNPDYIAGGSSSGSGAATAARLVFGALGSDTGGSVRLPAAANGVFGLKPTTGRVSRHGTMGLSFTLDAIGILARRARDCARIFAVIAGSDPLDSTTNTTPLGAIQASLTGDIAGIRIGVPRASLGLDPEVEAARVQSLAVLESLGARCVEIDVPESDSLADLSNLILGVEAATLHLPWLRSRPEDYASQVLSRLLPGLAYSGIDYLEALRVRAHYLAEFATQVLSHCDVLHWPVMPFPVPTLRDSDVGASQAMAAMISRISRFTRPLNYLGLPGLSVPTGFDQAGLPLAFKFIGRPLSEGMLLNIGHAYEQATKFTSCCPVLAA